LRFRPQDLSVTFPNLHVVNSQNPNLLVTGGAGFIGSNLTLALQEKYPAARLTVIDDFRSGDFKNLRGYRGDLVAADLAALDWRAQFDDPAAAGFDAIFHLASMS
jgi:ADP-L-glycero-D-manno-heptose 6-epimerase